MTGNQFWRGSVAQSDTVCSTSWGYYALGRLSIKNEFRRDMV